MLLVAILAAPGEIQIHLRMWTDDAAHAQKTLDEIVQGFELALTDRIFVEGLKGDLIARGKRMGLILDVGGYYKNVFTLAPCFEITEDEIDLGVELLEQLILPADELTRTQLRKLLEDWLVERDGMLVPPVEETICAIIKITANSSGTQF